VSDLDTVRVFDRKTGAPTAEVKVPGATSLHDVAVADDGRVLVCDSGQTRGDPGLDRTGTDAVYAIDKDRKVTVVAKGRHLDVPNRLFAAGDQIWVVTYYSPPELYSLAKDGTKGGSQVVGEGLNGIVVLASGDMLVSSWNAIYRRSPSGGGLTQVITNVPYPADIGYDTKRGRVLVPLSRDNELRAYDVE
jgi:hypothetical protein